MFNSKLLFLFLLASSGINCVRSIQFGYGGYRQPAPSYLSNNGYKQNACPPDQQLLV